MLRHGLDNIYSKGKSRSSRCTTRFLLVIYPSLSPSLINTLRRRLSSPPSSPCSSFLSPPTSSIPYGLVTALAATAHTFLSTASPPGPCRCDTGFRMLLRGGLCLQHGGTEYKTGWLWLWVRGQIQDTTLMRVKSWTRCQRMRTCGRGWSARLGDLGVVGDQICREG